MKKIVIMVTVPVVLETWLKGQAKFLSNYYEVEIVTSYSDKIQSIKEYENVSVKIVDFNRKINIFKDLKVLIQLTVYLLKKKPLIVYTLTPKAGLLGMISSWITRVPHRLHSVVGLPHLEATGIRKKILTITEKTTYFFSSKIYCNSKILTATVKNMTAKEVAIIGNGSVNGVDTEFFKDKFSESQKNKIKDNLKLKKDDFIITFVGRIVKDKGIDELLSVFDLLSDKYPKIKLLLIGDYKNESDPISKQSHQIIKENNSVKYIEFQDDIRKYLCITNLFVLPSYREGLPNVLIEAGSFNIPLLATDINGCNEVIEHNINGMLVKKKDEVALFHAMEKFIIDEKFYNFVRCNVRDSIVKKYDQKYFWNELLGELKKLDMDI
ncbi:glycosyltransferase family 4 protein [Sulfurimonas hydrogeniphila]|uniref:glycosyltransferase family 4 protein n=1 Tax=Sulfurimonas hydrogeniphila TaxID=2509341 RepID=UPI00125F8F34|nr:glycosyltransferase family 4 protein [Sulfurimonas hydrogeniphila]